jgi:hypothetical protein
MRCLFLLSLLLLLPLLSQAQYRSVFGKKSTSWNVLTEIIDGVRTDSITSTGDSVLNGKTYKVVKHHGGNEFLCLIREDTSRGRVWVLLKGSELLVMDLSLQENDSFPFAGEIKASDDNNLPVTRTFNMNGLKYIAFQPLTTEDSTYFIEGIGPTTGFFYKIDSDLGYYYFGREDYLLCSYKDGHRVYTNNSTRAEIHGKCYVNIVDLKEKNIANEAVHVFPNPGSSIIDFQFRNAGAIITTLLIYDPLGCLTDKISTNSNSIQISKGNKAAGIYYYCLLRQNQLISSGKIEFTP